MILPGDEIEILRSIFSFIKLQGGEKVPGQIELTIFQLW